jgi:hypothetical protein
MFEHTTKVDLNVTDHPFTRGRYQPAEHDHQRHSGSASQISLRGTEAAVRRSKPLRDRGAGKCEGFLKWFRVILATLRGLRPGSRENFRRADISSERWRFNALRRRGPDQRVAGLPENNKPVILHVVREDRIIRNGNDILQAVTGSRSREPTRQKSIRFTRLASPAGGS